MTSEPEAETNNEVHERRPLINRSNLRDLIIIVCLFSAVLYDLDWIRLALSGFLLIAGCFFHYMTKGVLIRNVVLCQSGTYRIVRHPYYMANYLIDSSFCLMSGNVYLMLVYPFLFYWSYGPTIRQEETTLARLHNSDFLRYSLEVPQIFPDAYSIRSMNKIGKGFSTQRITRNEISRFMRFWATACFILFIHTFKTSNFAMIWHFDTSYIHQYPQGFALLAFTLVLFITSLLVQSKKERRILNAE
jgi:hypothetical protein